MQDARRNYKDLNAPDCAKQAQQAVVAAMDSEIQGFLSFMRQDSDTQVSNLMADAAQKMQLARREIDKLTLLMGTPLPPIANADPDIHPYPVPTATNTLPPTSTPIPPPTPIIVGLRTRLSAQGFGWQVLRVEQVRHCRAM